jgi:hypothetical protein
LGSGLFAQFAAGVSQTQTVLGKLSVSGGVASATMRGLDDAVSAGSPFDLRLLMMSAALAAVAGGLFLTRAIREI